MKFLRGVVAVVVFMMGLALVSEVASAACGWRYTLEAIPDELFFVEGKEAAQGSELTVKAEKLFDPAIADECLLRAESKLEGVTVGFVYCPDDPSLPCLEMSDDDVYTRFYPSFDTIPNQTRQLVVRANASAKEGAGLIILYQLVDAVFEPVGTIQVHVQKHKPELCFGIPTERYDWAFGELPGGRLHHERALPDSLAQSFEQMGIQMSYHIENTLPPSALFTYDSINQRAVVLGSVPQQSADHQLQIKLLDRDGCERGLLYLNMRIQPQDAFLSVSADANATQVCGLQFSHELEISWQISGVQSMTEVIIEITGPDGAVETLGTDTLEGSRIFNLTYPGGGSVSVKVKVKDGGSSSSAQASVQLGTCP